MLIRSGPMSCVSPLSSECGISIQDEGRDRRNVSGWKSDVKSGRPWKR